MSGTLTTPQSRNEEYLGAIVGQSGVTAPTNPQSREEEYLAYLNEHGMANAHDNQTIIKDTNDKLKTAIGGYKTAGSTVTIVDGVFTEESGSGGKFLKNLASYAPFESGASSVTVHLVGSYTTEEGGEVELNGDYTFVPGTEPYSYVYWFAVGSDNASISFYGASSPTYSYQAKAEFKGVVFTAATLKATAVGSDVYTPIDARYIPIDNSTIKININGQLYVDTTALNG